MVEFYTLMAAYFFFMFSAGNFMLLLLNNINSYCIQKRTISVHLTMKYKKKSQSWFFLNMKLLHSG